MIGNFHAVSKRTSTREAPRNPTMVIQQRFTIDQCPLCDIYTAQQGDIISVDMP
jgi:hypothetical protein